MLLPSALSSSEAPFYQTSSYALLKLFVFELTRTAMLSPDFTLSTGASSDSSRHWYWGDDDEDDLVWHYLPHYGNPGGEALLSTYSKNVSVERPVDRVGYPVTALTRAGGGFPMDVISNTSTVFPHFQQSSFERTWPLDGECVSGTSGLTDGDNGHSLRPVFCTESDAAFVSSEHSSSQFLNSLDNSPYTPAQAVTVSSPEMLSPRDARPRVPAAPNFETSRGSSSKNRRPRHPRPQNRPNLNPPPAFSKAAANTTGGTMALRTLIRKLLAGTGWIMNSSINNREARNLLRELVGDKLFSRTQNFPFGRYAHSPAANSKTLEIQMLLPGIIYYYTQTLVTLEEIDNLIRRDRGPYRLTKEFENVLNHRPWPPCNPSEETMRYYGCYREGEKPRRA